MVAVPSAEGSAERDAVADGEEPEPAPFVSLELQVPSGQWLRLQALVDSGADALVLDARFASLLGFSLDNLHKETVVVVGGKTDAWTGASPVNARIVPAIHNEFQIRPTFVRPRWHVRLGRTIRRVRTPETTLLGRGDFMSSWDVVLSEKRQTLVLVWGEMTDFWDAAADLAPQRLEVGQGLSFLYRDPPSADAEDSDAPAADTAPADDVRD